MFVTNTVTVDTRVVKQAASLARSGRQVLVLGAAEADEPAAQDFQGFAIRRVAPDPIRGPAPAWLPLALRWVLGLWRYWRGAYRAAREFGPAVCHAHDLPVLPVAFLVSRRAGARLVYDAHELFTEIGRLGFPVRVGFRLLESLLIGRADRTMTVNESIAGELARRYGVPPPVVVMNCPRVDEPVPGREQSPLRARLGLGAEVPLVLFQGMFMPGRGLDQLVRAIALTRRAHLAFMGWGPLRAELEAQARAEGVGERVHFTEGVPLADLLAFTAGADVGAIPYRAVGLNNSLTSPNKLFEYAVAGVPVVGSRFPELRKVIEGRGLGRTFDPEQPAEIAAAIDALVEDSEELARVRRNVAAAAPDLTWGAQERVLLELYAELEGR